MNTGVVASGFKNDVFHIVVQPSLRCKKDLEDTKLEVLLNDDLSKNVEPGKFQTLPKT